VCVWRELITVPDTGKCSGINNSSTLMLKWVNCLGENELPPTVGHDYGGFILLPWVLSCYRSVAHSALSW
jgi:hypothetical protein